MLVAACQCEPCWSDHLYVFDMPYAYHIRTDVTFMLFTQSQQHGAFAHHVQWYDTFSIL